MKTIQIKAARRRECGTRGANRLRRAGKIPAVLYGRDIKPLLLEVDLTDFEDILHHAASENLLMDLQIEGEPSTVLAITKEIQHHPITGRVIHVDFQRVVETEKVEISVPVETVGEAPGVRAGGILEHVLFQIRVRAKPRELPEVILVDVSRLELGQTLHVRDIVPPPGVEILMDPDVPVVTIARPAVGVEEEEGVPAAEAAEAAEEPQVIKRGKEEEEPKEAEGE